MARVLVLEDAVERVEWLQSVLRRSRAEVVWCKDVESFLDEAKKDHDLVIFDHDLEVLPGTPYGEAPLNGAYAAQEYDPQDKVPVLVWSMNPDGAKRIVDILQSKGIVATKVPFELRNLEKLATALRRMFE